MEREQYWPQHKVYFYGQLALFPEKLKVAKSKDELSHYFATHSSTNEFLTSLDGLEQAGYYKLDIVISDEYLHWENKQRKMIDRADVFSSVSYDLPELGKLYDKIEQQAPLSTNELSQVLAGRYKNKLEPYLRFKFTDINKQKFYDELEAYLEKYCDNKLFTDDPNKPENFANQQAKLAKAVAEDYAQHELEPIISRPTMWPHPPIHDTFWELILAHQIVTGDIWLLNIGYDDQKAQRLAAGISTVDRTGTIPFAEFRVESEKFKKTTVPQKAAKAVKTDCSLGLLVVTEDNRVLLNGKDLGLRAQLRHLCRLLVTQSPEIVLLDELEKNADIIDPNKHLKNPRQNVQKYISELRSALGNEFVIRNDEQEGYRLLLRSAVKSE